MKAETLAILLLAPASAFAQAAWPEVVDPASVLGIGDVTGPSDAYIFTEINDLAVLGDSILVLEGLTNEVRIFDHAGHFLGRLGRRGEGPGEFEWPTRLRVGPEGITVVDLTARRQTSFSLGGDLVGTDPIAHPGGLRLSDFVPLRGGLAVAETSVFVSAEEGAHPERTVAVVDPRSGRIDTLATYQTGWLFYRAPDSYGILQERVGVGGDWALAGDSLLAVVAGNPPVLRWWRAGPEGLSPAGRIELPIEPERFTSDDERDAIEAESRYRRDEGAPPLSRSARVEAPSFWGQVKQVVLSDDGRAWIQWDEPRTDDDPRWFLADLSAGRLSRVALPRGFRMLAAARGRLYGFALDELDVPRVQVYRVTGIPGR